MTDAPRLKARLRVQALLRQGQAAGSFGAVVRRGDDEAGALLVLLRSADGGMAVFAEARAPDGTSGFLRAAPDGTAAASSYVERAVGRDPDLWVVEFDGLADGSLPFPARLL